MSSILSGGTMKKIKPNLNIREVYSPKFKPVFQGAMEDGRQAFLSGLSVTTCPYSSYSNVGKQQTWESGWRKAKLAKEQGKKSL